MISIINKGPHNPKDPGGERTYHVEINGKLIATFQHRRLDGLSVCLRKASEATASSRLFEVCNALQGDLNAI